MTTAPSAPATTAGAHVVVVHGPTARLRVAALAGVDDLVLDLDAITATLAPAGRTLGRADAARHVALGALHGALTRASRLREHVTVWLVEPAAGASQLAAYRRRGYDLMGPGR